MVQYLTIIYLKYIYTVFTEYMYTVFNLSKKVSTEAEIKVLEKSLDYTPI